MAKIIVGAAMLVAGIALMIYCGPMGTTAMMALDGAIASTGFSMVLGGIAQTLQGQHSPAIGIAVKQAACPWNVVYGRSRVGGVIAYLNTYAQQMLRSICLLPTSATTSHASATRVAKDCPSADCILTARIGRAAR